MPILPMGIVRNGAGQGHPPAKAPQSHLDHRRAHPTEGRERHHPGSPDYLALTLGSTMTSALRALEHCHSSTGSTVTAILHRPAPHPTPPRATMPPVGTHSGGHGSVLQARCLLGSLLWALQW